MADQVTGYSTIYIAVIEYLLNVTTNLRERASRTKGIITLIEYDQGHIQGGYVPQNALISADDQISEVYHRLHQYCRPRILAKPSTFIVHVLDSPYAPWYPNIKAAFPEVPLDDLKYPAHFIVMNYDNYARYSVSRSSRLTAGVARIIAQTILESYPWGKMQLRVGTDYLSLPRSLTGDALVDHAHRILDMDEAPMGLSVTRIKSNEAATPAAVSPVVRLYVEKLNAVHGNDIVPSNVEVTDHRYNRRLAVARYEADRRIELAAGGYMVVPDSDLKERYRRSYTTHKDGRKMILSFGLPGLEKFSMVPRTPDHSDYFTHKARREIVGNIVKSFPWSRAQFTVGGLTKVAPVIPRTGTNFWLTRLMDILNLDEFTRGITVTWTHSREDHTAFHPVPVTPHTSKRLGGASQRR